MKGQLKVSLPTKTKPLAGGAVGSKGGSKKNLMQFRMLEKEGQIVGMWRFGRYPDRYPYEASAKEFTVMLNLSKAVRF